MALILNPHVHMKKESKRILIYCVTDFTHEVSNLTFIHPAIAILLASFDGEKEHQKLMEEFCYMMDWEYNEETIAKIENRLKRLQDQLAIKDLLVEKDSLSQELQKPRYQPKDFLLNAEELNLDTGNMRIEFPLAMNYNVTTKCEMACRYCYHPRYQMDEYISLERLDEIFTECANNGLESVTLTGGDPFDRPDIIDIMELINNKGLLYFISTKSYLDKETCRQLKERAKLPAIQISLDAAEPKLAAFLAGMDDDFLERTIETVKNLRSFGIQVRLKSVVTGYNIDYVAEYLELCRELEVEQVQIMPYSRSAWMHDDKLFATREQMDRALAVINEFESKYDYPKIYKGDFNPNVVTNLEPTAEDLFEKRSICNACRFCITMLPNGEVSICEQLPYTPEVILGDLRKQSILEFWNSRGALDFLTPPPRSKYSDEVPCASCDEEAYKLCHTKYSICLRDSYNYFKNLNSPDLRCKLAVVDHFKLT